VSWAICAQLVFENKLSSLYIYRERDRLGCSMKHQTSCALHPYLEFKNSQGTKFVDLTFSAI
jgi:hypothetical protein